MSITESYFIYERKIVSDTSGVSERIPLLLGVVLGLVSEAFGLFAVLRGIFPRGQLNAPRS